MDNYWQFADSSCSLFSPMQDEFYAGLLDGEINNGYCLWDDLNLDEIKSSHDQSKNKEIIAEEEEEEAKEIIMVEEKSSAREEIKDITFEDVSRYFYMPITQAAKELKVGLTLLKKKCRELGIQRWPHRKMKSIQTLIKNLQELGREEGQVGEAQQQQLIRSALDILEQEKKIMEKEPDTKMEERTKRLRQACFKVNYKKKKSRLMMALCEDNLPTITCGTNSQYLTGLHGGISSSFDTTSSSNNTWPAGIFINHDKINSSSTRPVILGKYAANFQEQKISLAQPNCSTSGSIPAVTMTESVMCSAGKGTHGIQKLLLHGGSLEHEIMGPDHVRNVVQVKETDKPNVYNPVNPNQTIVDDSTSDSYHVPADDYHFRPALPQFESSKEYSQVEFAASYVKQYAIISDMDNREHGGDLKKLDSFGRWMMNTEIGRDCDNSLLMTTSDHSGSYLRSFDTQNDNKEVNSSLFCHMQQLDMDLLGPSLSQNQSFSIIDFSPDWAWAFSNVETKVLISGTFLGGIDPSSIKWCCMFGEQEVSAEVLTSNVLRCKVPTSHAPPGRVPFYITCSNRLACSEVREFEFRENLPSNTASSSNTVCEVSQPTSSSLPS